MKEYREKIKADPEKFQKYKADAKARAKKSRTSLTPEQKKVNNEKAKIRRAKKLASEKNQPTKKDSKTLTRRQCEKQREYWREQKRNWRKQLSAQKKRREREKLAVRVKTLRQVGKLQKVPINEPNLGTATEDPIIEQIPEDPVLEAVLDQLVLDDVPDKSYSSNAQRKAYSRAKKALPVDPQMYALVIKRLISKATPLKVIALKKEGIISESPKKKETVKKQLHFYKAVAEGVGMKLQDSGSKTNTFKERKIVAHYVANTLRKYRLLRKAAKMFKVNRKYLIKSAKNFGDLLHQSRKKRKDALSSDTEQMVINFYNRGDVSREMPTKKLVTGLQVNNLESKRVMELSLKQAYTDFLLSRPTHQLSFSVFSKLRPKNVKTQKHAKMYSCLCETCQNMRLRLKVVNKIAQAKGLNMKLDIFNTINISLCQKLKGQVHHNIACVNRKCYNCGTYLLKEKLLPLLTIANPEQDIPLSAANPEQDIPLSTANPEQDILLSAANPEQDLLKSTANPEQNIPSLTTLNPKEEIITWQSWGIERLPNLGEKKGATRKTLIDLTGTLETLVNEVVEYSNTLASHLFIARWQHIQFQEISSNPSINHVTMVQDFAENYTCNFQEEAQSAYYTQETVTIHPIVCYYNCPLNCGSVVRDSLVFVSDDHSHDHHAVQKFTEVAIDFLIKKRNLVINKVLKFSDCASSQYKSKGPFMDVSCSKEDFKFPVEVHFYGARHGKGPSDGETAVVKSAVTRAVANRKATIRNAREFYNYLKGSQLIINKTECCHFKRDCFLVTETEINRTRPERFVKTSVPGTRKIFAVRGVAPGEIETRELSCFCNICRLSGDTTNCQNKDYVESWKYVHLNVDRPTIEQNPLSENIIPIVQLTDLENTQNIIVQKNHKAGEYVAINLQCKKYVALILNIDEESREYQLKYLRQKDENIFVWPVIDDISWESGEVILNGVNVPQMINNRRDSYCLDKADWILFNV